MTPEEIIDKVYEILIEEGQNDERFGWGDIIKYRPSEVQEILFRRKDEFKS